LGNLAVDADWEDVIATYGAAASVDVLIQNLDDEEVDVVFSASGTKPSGKSGNRLDTYDSIQGSAAHIWVRGSGTISVATV
jgi:hypothetical protein